MSLKPPATPRPGIGDELRTATTASLTRRRELLAQPGHDVVGVQPGACRSSNGSRTMNIEPKLDALACSRNDMPAMATVCATPGVSWAICYDLRHRLLGPLQRRRVGQLDVDDQPALVLLRDEARGALLKDPVGQDQQAAVDQQHDHAEPERLADRPAVDVGHAVEQPVEAAEQPAEHGVDRPDDQPADRQAGHQRRARNTTAVAVQDSSLAASASPAAGRCAPAGRTGRPGSCGPVPERQEPAQQTEDPPGQRLALELVPVLPLARS